MPLVDYGSSSDEDETHTNSNVTLAQVKAANKRALPVTSEPNSASGKKYVTITAVAATLSNPLLQCLTTDSFS